jgi:hemolysin III
MSNRTQTLSEEIANAITHGLGVVFALFATPILLEKSSKSTVYDTHLGVWMFGFGMFAVYLCSTLYHGIQTPKLKDKLLTCDYISIFFLIGGSYLPFVQAYTTPQTATIFLTAQWTAIGIGSIIKLFFSKRYEKYSLLSYIFLGFSVCFLIKPLMENMPMEVFKWVLLGGLSYSIGIGFYLWDKQKYAHAIWHICVLGGTVAHYIAIWKISDFIGK